MPAGTNTLREYLVKLGWGIDKQGFKSAQDMADSLGKSAQKTGKSFVSNMALAGTAVVNFIVTANAAMVGLLKSIADADLETERWARRMWTTEESARSLLSALGAMGKSFDDIAYMTPEEYQYLLELRGLASNLNAPAELQNTLQQVRGIEQEFNKLKIIVQYIGQWVAYYLGQYLNLSDVKSEFSDFNNWLSSNISVVAEKVTKFFITMYKLGKTLVTTIITLKDAISDLFNSMSTESKTAASALAGFLGLMKLGPVGVFIAALTLLLLLLEDFIGWQQGKDAAFGGVWSKLTEWMNSEKVQEFGDKFKGVLDSLLTNVFKLFDALSDLFIKVWDFLNKHGIIEGILNGFIGLLQTISDIIGVIADAIYLISGSTDKIDRNSYIGKIITPYDDPEEDHPFWKALANAGMGLMDGINNAWNNILGQEPGDALYAAPWSSIFGYNYGNAAASNAASNQSSSTTNNENRTLNQSNTINVYGSDATQNATAIQRMLQSQTDYAPLG